MSKGRHQHLVIAERRTHFFNVGNTDGKETGSMAKTLAALVELMPKGKSERKAKALNNAEAKSPQQLS